MDQPSPMNLFPQGVAAGRKNKNSKKWLVLAVLLIFIGTTAFALPRFFKKAPVAKPSPTPSPTPEIFPTDTPFPTLTDEPTSAPTSTIQNPTQNPIDKTTGLDKSTLNVAVENGSGQIGGASKGAEALRSFGYHVVSVGNADNFDYELTIIKIKEAKKAFLPLLKKDLSTAYTVSSSEDLSASSSADALVIVGKQ